MKNYKTDIEVVEGLTQEQLELAYRKRERMYHIEDAKQLVNDYKQWYDLEDLVITEGDYEVMAERFEDQHDCEVADNKIWELIIREYVDEMRRQNSYQTAENCDNHEPITKHVGWAQYSCSYCGTIIEGPKHVCADCGALFCEECYNSGMLEQHTCD